MKRTAALILVLVLALGFASCESETVENEDGVSVVATLFPQYDFARAILCEKGSVKLLLTPGADSHSFELTASDMKAINGCDVFVYTGPDMEIWVDGIISSINSKVNVIELFHAADVENVPQDHEHNHSDPHIWTSPVIAQRMLKTVFDAICNVDPDNYDYYYNNYIKYNNSLEKLDTEFSDIADNANSRKLYFSGKFAFYHFVKEYGLEYYAPFNSCSDVQIESIAAVRSLIEEIKAENINYIFYEELSSNTIIDTIVKETGVTPLLLHSAHNVSKDDLQNGTTYIEIMEQNAINLRKALCNG